MFEEARNCDEELIIHQEGLLFTSNEPEEPVSTLKIASARVLDVQQHGNFVPFSDPEFVRQAISPSFSFRTRTSWHRKKRKCKLRAMCKALSVPF